MSDLYENWNTFPCRPRRSIRSITKNQELIALFKTNYTATYGRYSPAPVPRTVDFPPSVPGSISGSRPGTSLSRPGTGFSRPGTGMSRPNSAIHNPNTSFSRPNSAYNNPNTSFSRPNSAHNQQTGSSRPNSGNNRSQTGINWSDKGNLVAPSRPSSAIRQYQAAQGKGLEVKIQGQGVTDSEVKGQIQGQAVQEVELESALSISSTSTCYSGSSSNSSTSPTVKKVLQPRIITITAKAPHKKLQRLGRHTYSSERKLGGHRGAPTPPLLSALGRFNWHTMATQRDNARCLYTRNGACK